MFTKIQKTSFPPKERPVMIWDGECGLCKYWTTHWKSHTEDKIDYSPYQKIAENFKDIPLKEFKKASRLIETDGFIYSGPDSAFRSFEYFNTKKFPWHRWYRKFKFFRWLCDHTYNVIAKNRGFFFKISKLLFGNNPTNLKPYWVLYIVLFLVILFLLLKNL